MQKMVVHRGEVAKMTLSSIINDAPAWVKCAEEAERGMIIAQMV